MAERVFLGMSGGVDSTVAAILLKEAGYEVHGYTYRVYDSVSEDCLKKQKGCCTVESIFEAKEVADKLGISHQIIDLRKDFADTVIRHFTESYMAGRTPNPCTECNRVIKWGRIREEADKAGCRYLATGHYARIGEMDGKHFLTAGADPAKDQTYFLWQVPRHLLAHTLFPLGNLQKDEVRKIALSNGLNKMSAKPDSQEICFIPGDNYREFLQEHVSQLPGPGDFVDTSGKILGKHRGFPFYTIGQRKGLGIAMGERAYVTEIHPATNRVVLGSPGDLNAMGMWVQNFNPGKADALEQGMRLKVRVRYRSQPVEATIGCSENGMTEVLFHEPVQAVTPGQSAVFYDENDLAGGAIIHSIIKK